VKALYPIAVSQLDESHLNSKENGKLGTIF